MAARLKSIFTASLLSAALLLGCSTVDPQLVVTQPPGSAEFRNVVRVVDGDTIVLNLNEKVRLIGVDTPETVHPKKAVQCFGKDAKAFTQSMVEGKSVRLVLDARNVKQHHKDRYGRTLGYVYLEDGRMLNAELVRQGYAHAYTRFPFRYLIEFRNLERDARQNGTGLWSSCPIS
jgi:micrococcal nuclease